MFTASSAAVATSMAAARLFFIICCVQLMVISVNAVDDVNEVEEKLNGQLRHVNAGYNTYIGWGWSPSGDCDFLDADEDLSAHDCRIVCTDNEYCTAVNYRPSDRYCRLIKCPVPVQVPTEFNSDYVGYSIIEGDCEHFGGVIFEDKCLYFSGSESSELRSWEGAKEACSTKPGELAIFSDDPHLALSYIEARDSTVVRYWVGGSDHSMEGTDWEWNNGVPIPLDHFEFPWRDGEPNGPSYEHCLNVLRTENGHGYNDETCSYVHEFICELGCAFSGTIFPPGTFILNACAQLQCNGNTGKFDFRGYDELCSRCSVYWEPHIQPFDWSGSYVYNKCGNYSLTQIGRSRDPPVAVYSSFVSCDTSTRYDLTCVGTVTFKNDEDTVITAGYDAIENILELQVNGVDVKPDALSTSPSVIQDTNDKVYPVVAWTSLRTETYFDIEAKCINLQGSSGIAVRYCGDPVNNANAVFIWASYEIAHELSGLCGTANDNTADDFTSRDGTIGSIDYPYDFPLSWLTSGASDGNCNNKIRSATLRTQSKCDANSTLQDVYQSQCENSVSLGFSDAGIDLSQVLIDDCVHDLCHVTDSNKWMGSVDGALPVHAEIKEKTVGHCLHKRTHKCKTHNGTCILKTDNCEGTIIERGCHGKNCVCCAPNTCKQDPACVNRGGKCILRKDWAGCDGSLNSELCSGPHCACCYINPQTSCKKTKGCSRVNGECMSRSDWENCDGELKIKWCKGNNCGCCYKK